LARLILTPSEAIRGDLAHLFRIAPEKIEAIPHAPSERLRAADPNAVTERLQKLQITRPYLLYLGSGEPRKNLATLIDAWRGARRTIENLDLVLVGPESVPCGEGPQPRLLGRCDDATVAAFLSGAAAFVYPSLYEGFGLPVLEAMQAGVAVIVSRDPALLETAGGAARDVDALSVADWRKAIVETVQSPDESNRLRSLGRERARSFQWSLTAKRTRAAYERAIRRP
jgi:glycosyltransferase involved in cell wall biosynthesis